MNKLNLYSNPIKKNHPCRPVKAMGLCTRISEQVQGLSKYAYQLDYSAKTHWIFALVAPTQGIFIS